MRIRTYLQQWWQRRTSEEDTPFDGDSPAFVASLLFHLVLLVVLGLTPFLTPEPAISLTLTAPIEDPVEELQLPQEVVWSPQESEQVGANSVDGDLVAMSEAPVIAEVSDVPNFLDMTPTDTGVIEFNQEIFEATGLHFNENVFTKGHAGQGTTGAEGAVDRITHEIMLSLEQRKTLVVWLFDQSGSLSRQRSAIKKRFGKIYEELGIIEAAGNPAFAKHEDKPLLTSVIAFGETVTMMTSQPTDDLTEITQAVENIQEDGSGVERVFSAIFMAAKRHTTYRMPKDDSRTPERNVMLIAFTDEAGDDFRKGLDSTISYCRRYEMPVYVVGVPAPFGRAETMVKWVDPDPEYDQRPQWGRVDQGPESFMPERIRLTFDGKVEDDAPIDSGFGPFALTRLCYETGGIYFAVHPNRNVSREVSRRETTAFSAHLRHFFDPQVMRRYRPDYVPESEYLRRINASKARSALVRAAQVSWITPMESPRLVFVKRSEAELANDLSEAQKVAAKLAPKVAQLYDVIKLGESDRPIEQSPRWQAGFDLAIGRVAAVRIRTESYNAMLAKAKRGMKFDGEKNNTWVLAPDEEVSVGSQHENIAKKAREYLQRVVDEHPGTPWALLAEKELHRPMGWKWTEKFTDLTPPGRRNGGNNNNNAPANDQRRMMKKPPPRRSVPKL